MSFYAMLLLPIGILCIFCGSAIQRDGLNKQLDIIVQIALILTSEQIAHITGCVVLFVLMIVIKPNWFRGLRCNWIFAPKQWDNEVSMFSTILYMLTLVFWAAICATVVTLIDFTTMVPLQVTSRLIMSSVYITGIEYAEAVMRKIAFGSSEL